MEELARKLTEVANQMTVIGTEMTYYGGFDEQMVRHGYEMIGAAVVALGWAEEVDKAKDRAERANLSAAAEPPCHECEANLADCSRGPEDREDCLAEMAAEPQEIAEQ